VPDGSKCATLYEKYPAMGYGKSILIGDVEVSDLRYLEDGAWTKSVSYVEVEPQCILEGYQNPDYSGMLGKWRGMLSAPNRHEMDAKYERNKMESLKCSCERRTCAEHYSYGNGIRSGCPAPMCDVITYEMVDAWKKKVNASYHLKA